MAGSNELSSRKVPPPFMVSYGITRKCNLNCKHCYAQATEEAAPDELSTREAKALIDDLAEWGVRFLVLDGGEPLCRADFLEIASHASSKGIMTGIGSNGTLLDRDVAGAMKRAGIQVVAISIDSTRGEVHDDFRGKRGAFYQAMNGVTACKEAGLPFQFGMVIRKETLSELPDMLNLAVTSGANAAEFFDLVEVGRAKTDCRGSSLNAAERKWAMEWLAQAQVECPIVIRVPACPMYTLVLQEKQIKPKHFPQETLMRIPYYGRGCAAGMPFGYLRVAPNGEVNPCMLLQIDLGNIRERHIQKIWQESPILQQLRSRELGGACSQCSFKNICAGCRGRAYAETGDMMAADPGCWLAPAPAASQPHLYEKPLASSR
jgi:AdoMet-dependent heme synthase